MYFIILDYTVRSRSVREFSQHFVKVEDYSLSWQNIIWTKRIDANNYIRSQKVESVCFVISRKNGDRASDSRVVTVLRDNPSNNIDLKFGDNFTLKPSQLRLLV